MSNVGVDITLKLHDELTPQIDKTVRKTHALESSFTGIESKADKALNAATADFKKLTKEAEKAKQEMEGIGKNDGGGMAEKSSGIMDMIGAIPGGDMLSSLMANPYVAAGTLIVGAATAIVTNLNEVTKAFGDNRDSVKMYFKEIKDNDALISLTAQSSALASTFAVDAKEINSAANVMAKEFGVDAASSFETLQKAMLATHGEMDLSFLREYSTQAKQAGMTVNDLATITAKSHLAGIYDDKALDAIKEAGLRLRENTKPVDDTISKYGKALGLQKGFMGGIKSGSLSVVDAVTEISKGLDNLDQQGRQEVITNIFGGAGEDVGRQFFEMMKEGKGSLDDLIDGSDTYIIRQQTRLDLETKIQKRIGEIEPTITAIRDRFDVLVLKARLFFYDTVKKGMDWFASFSESPTWQKISSVWDGLVSKSREFFDFVQPQFEVLGNIIGEVFSRAWDNLGKFISDLDIIDQKLGAMFGGDSIMSMYFEKVKSDWKAILQTINLAVLGAKIVADPFGMSMEEINKEYNSIFASPANAAVDNEYGNRQSNWIKPGEKYAPDNKILEGIAKPKTSQIQPKASGSNQSSGGVVSGDGKTRSIVVNVYYNQKVEVANAKDNGEIRDFSKKTSTIMMDEITRELRNYENTF